MGRSVESKQRRKAVLAQRKADKKARHKAAQAAKNQPESPGMMSTMWNMLPSFGGENEVESKRADPVNESLEGRGLRHEQEQGYGDQAGKEDEDWSMWDLVPSFFSKEAEAEDGDQYSRMGDDDNHIDFLSSKSTRKGSAKVGVNGLDIEGEAERSASLMSAEGEYERQLSERVHGKVEGSGDLGIAEASAKGSLHADRSGVDAKGELGAGVYAGKAEAAAQLGFKIPFVNAMLTGGGKVEGSVGLGGSAEGHVKAGPDAYSMGGKLSGALGPGVGVGYSMGLSKADPEKGWFDRSAQKSN